jgi:hypothetical protein
VVGPTKFVSVAQAIGQKVRATAKCDVGEVIVGGGGEIFPSSPLVFDQAAGIALGVSKAVPPREWIVETTRTNTDQTGGDNGDVRAYAVCAHAPTAKTGE